MDEDKILECPCGCASFTLARTPRKIVARCVSCYSQRTYNRRDRKVIVQNFNPDTGRFDPAFTLKTEETENVTTADPKTEKDNAPSIGL